MKLVVVVWMKRQKVAARLCQKPVANDDEHGRSRLHQPRWSTCRTRWVGLRREQNALRSEQNVALLYYVVVLDGHNALWTQRTGAACRVKSRTRLPTLSLAVPKSAHHLCCCSPMSLGFHANDEVLL